MRIITVIILILLFPLISFQQTSEGPNNPSISGEAGAGTSWINMGNVFTSNNSRSRTGNMGNGDNSTYLGSTGFGFTIPLTATIDGITVEIERSRNNGGSGRIRDLTIQLTKDAATLVGNNYADGGTNWPSNDAYATYGGAADLWGTTWTPAEINVATFGVVVRARKLGGGNRRARIDHIRITVHYTEALPVELVSFKTYCEKKTVVIEWATASETNNDYFEILKSSDLAEWEKVMIVKGNNGNTITRYQFFDEIEFMSDTTLYYRLKQVDFDGNYEEFDITHVYCKDTERSYVIYPNPIRQGMKLNVVGLKENEIVRVYDINGKSYSIDKLPKGTYIVVINDYSFKLMVN